MNTDPETWDKVHELLGIPIDEPIFIIRAKDKFSVKIINMYRTLVKDHLPIGHFEIDPIAKKWLSNLDSIIKEFIHWQKVYPSKVKVPD